MLLLDSHVAVWGLIRDRRLGPDSVALLEGATGIHVSAASVWELTIKSMLGRAELPARFSERLVEKGVHLLQVNAAHTEGLRRFPQLVRHDPFDRLLLAQASIENLRFLTADRILLALGLDFVLDARV